MLQILSLRIAYADGYAIYADVLFFYLKTYLFF